jgi:hypothetical protein
MGLRASLSNRATADPSRLRDVQRAFVGTVTRERQGRRERGRMEREGSSLAPLLING